MSISKFEIRLSFSGYKEVRVILGKESIKIMPINKVFPRVENKLSPCIIMICDVHSKCFLHETEAGLKE